MTKYPVLDDSKGGKQANIVYNHLKKDTWPQECWPVFPVRAVIKTGFSKLTDAEIEIRKNQSHEIASDQLEATTSAVVPATISSPQKRTKHNG